MEMHLLAHLLLGKNMSQLSKILISFAIAVGFILFLAMPVYLGIEKIIFGTIISIVFIATLTAMIYTFIFDNNYGD